MSINVSIVEQRVQKIQKNCSDYLATALGLRDEPRQKSASFVVLCVQTFLDITPDEALNCLTEGAGDFGIDALHVSDVDENEFVVTLFQGKYKQTYNPDAEFPQSGIEKLIQAIRYLFDPASELTHVNDRIKYHLEQLRSLISEGNIPQVRVVACNNGKQWDEASQALIDMTGFGSQVQWRHLNHDELVRIMQASKPVNATVNLAGQAIIEDMNYTRVLVGRVSAWEIASLIQEHGDRLLERNIRRYLGLTGNRVNEAISKTLTSDNPERFYFYNNGITLTCDKFEHNGLQGSNYRVVIKNLQIINGGQTCMTIFKTLFKDGQQELYESDFNNIYVLVRLYQLPSDDTHLVQKITLATNSQNPVDLRDLKANDDIQQALETDMKGLGYIYKRKRDDVVSKPEVITSSTAAEALLSVWLKRPHLAKFKSKEHFGKFYETIFTPSTTATQTILAVLLYRIAENRRKRPEMKDPPLVRYASCFIAMEMGKLLLHDLGLARVTQLTPERYSAGIALVQEKGAGYFDEGVKNIETALANLYNHAENISLQQLSATFRRPDLVTAL